MSLIAATKQLQKDRTVLARQLERIDGALAALKGVSTNGARPAVRFTPRKSFKHTAATKRKITATQRKRMAALRKTK